MNAADCSATTVACIDWIMVGCFKLTVIEIRLRVGH